MAGSNETIVIDKRDLHVKLTEIFRSPVEGAGGTLPIAYSIEVAAKDDFDIEALERLSPQPISCALPWISDENLRYDADFQCAPSFQLTERLQKAHYTVVNHVSCYNLTEEQADRLLAAGIQNVFIVRGDTVNPAQAFLHSAGLVKYLRQHETHKLTIGVGGYPYGHHQSPSETDELRYLREKIDCGVDFLLTQTLYDAESFFRYRDRCRQAGISILTIPGIYLPHSYKHLQAMLNLTRIQLPPSIRSMFDAHANDPQDQFEAFVIDYFERVVRGILAPGAESSEPVRLVHFFSFNKFAMLQKLLFKLIDFF
ncbi:5,10-methylenetetrahydrofolate reductase [Anopheles nili]|uniref:5,10-methylenetetrahydrofolate reductase n=1 Tax=Anopheles nili TaxID=185578 RepID=UPI00237A4444|nr:5,10-methylenetetrahydrofolate reductase [Anopheles nili]